MYTIAMLMSLVGYGAGYEGYDGQKVYFGAYTPESEYGWVVSDRGIYLDTVLKKDLTSR